MYNERKNERTTHEQVIDDHLSRLLIVRFVSVCVTCKIVKSLTITTTNFFIFYEWQKQQGTKSTI